MARRRDRGRNRASEDVENNNVEERDDDLLDDSEDDDELAALEAELDGDDDTDDELDSEEEELDPEEEELDPEDDPDEELDPDDDPDSELDPEDDEDELAALEAELEDDDPDGDTADENDQDDQDDEDDEDDEDDDTEPVTSSARDRRGSRSRQNGDSASSVTGRQRHRRSSIAERLYSGELSFPFVPRRRVFYTFSAILILASIVIVGIRGINPGIEFKGGADFQVAVAVNDDTVSTFTDAVASAGLPDMTEVTVRTVGGDRVRVQTRTLDSTTEVPVVRQAIAEAAGVPASEVAYSLIGASWGSQITKMALIALGVFLGLVCLVIAIYFRNWKMSVAAMIALLHDLVVTVGVYGAVGFVVTPATVIGVLTILGYSLYDTVVVFDKVRENTKGLLGQTTSTYAESANLAVNQVLVRSINTTLIGVLPVAALLVTGVVVLGEGPIKDLSLALFVGMIAGAYSSIFIATPLLVQMKSREPDVAKHDKRVARRRGSSGHDRTAIRTTDSAETEDTRELVTAGTTTKRQQVSDSASGRPQPVRRPRSRRRR